jgi:hypothetical protein
MWKTKLYLFLSLMLAATGLYAHELAPAPTQVAIYIQAQDYSHELQLHHYAVGYWFRQGPLLESAALQVLSQDLKAVAMCDERPESAKLLLWLRPRMFYNPQVQTFYGKVIAYAYTPDGKPLGSFVGEAQTHGFLDVQPEANLQAAYLGAVQAVSVKLQADAKVQQALAGPDISAPCSTTGLLPEPKIQFMGF